MTTITSGSTGTTSGDKIVLGGGNDTIDGGLGSDTINAGAGNDTLIYTYANEAGVVDYYNAGSGSDTLVLDFSKYTQWTQASWSTFEATLTQRIAEFKAMVEQYKAANGNLPNTGSKDFVFDFGNGTKLQVSMTEKVVVVVPVLNSAPVITSGPQADAVQEDGTLVVGGMVTATDANTGNVLTYSGNATGVYGSFSVADNGKWTYTLDNRSNGTASKVQSLAEGEIQTETFTVTVSDGKGGTATQSVTITITGTNDAPVITSDVQAGEVKEDGTLVVSGTVTATDIDNAALTYSGDATGVYGSFSVAANGVWTYSLDNGTNGTASKVQSLAEGEIQTEIFTVTVSDGKGGTATQDVTITITGTNDAPIVRGTVSKSADEDGKPVPLDALAGASDVDNDTKLQVNMPQELPAGVTYDADTHTFTLDPGHADYQILREGVATTVVVNYSISDGLTTTPKSVQWVVTGTNDAPQVVRAVTGLANEDGAVSTLDAFVNIEDVDRGDVLTVVFSAGDTPSDPVTAVVMPAGLDGQTTTVSDASPTPSEPTTGLTPGGAGGDPNVYAFDPKNPPPGITYDEATHSFSLNPSDKAFQSLGEGETRTVTISYFVSDGKSTIPATLQWVVTGTNDVPIVLTRNGDSASADLTEGNAGLTASGSLSLMDPDVTDAVGARVISVAAVTAYTGDLPSTATLLDFFTATSTDTSNTAAANLRWEFDSKTEAFDFLSQGQELVLTYTVEVNDKQGGTATQDVTITITITGTNDAAVLSSDSVALDETNTALTASGALSVTDIDSSETFVAQTNTDGRYGKFSIGTDGVWRYVSNEAFNDLNTTSPPLVDTFDAFSADGTKTSVEITIIGTNDAAAITGQSIGMVTEAGVTAGTATATGALTSQDIDNENNLFTAASGASVQGYGSFSITAGGVWTYTLDNTNTTVNDLNAGDSRGDTFEVSSLDGTRTTVTLTITGTNDRPVITGTQTAGRLVEGGTLIATGTLTASDVDTVGPLNVALAPAVVDANGAAVTAPLGNLQLGAWDATTQAFTWTYSATDAELNFLGAQVTRTQVYTVNVSDGQGGSTPQDITITIRGTNDGPFISSGPETALTTRISEDGNGLARATGALNNQDAINPLRTGTLPSGTRYMDEYLIPSWIAGSSYTLTLTSTAFDTYLQIIKVGSPGALTFNDDGGGGTNSAATFTPVAGSTYLARVTSYSTTPSSQFGSYTLSGPQGSTATLLTGQVTASDADAGDTLQYSTLSPASYGTFTMNSTTGGWSYSLNKTLTAVQQLRAADILTDTVTVRVDDSQGGTADRAVAITIEGRNDAPVITSPAQTGSLAEDSSPTSVRLGALDSSDALGGSGGGGVGYVDELPLSGLTPGRPVLINLDGSFDPYLRIINAATREVVAFDDQSGPGDGAQIILEPQAGIQYLAQVTSFYSNATPSIATGTYSLSYSGIQAQGQVTASDVDLGARLTYSTTSNAAVYGAFSVNATTGAWSYLLNNNMAAVQSLGASGTLRETFTVNVSDTLGGTTSQTVTINIAGTNDAAVIGAPSVSTVTADVNVVSGRLTATGSITITDADAGQASFRAASLTGANNLGSLTLASSGAYTYQVDNSATQYLRAGETKTETFTVTALDGATKDVSFEIIGTRTSEPPSTNFTAANWTSDTTLPGAGAVIGTMATTDPDAAAGDPVSYYFTNASSVGLSTTTTLNGTTFSFSDGSLVSTGLQQEGVYTLYVRAQDSGGALSPVETITIVTCSNMNQLGYVVSGATGEYLIYALGNDGLTRPSIELGAGNDTVFGQYGIDYIDGGAGSDRLYGGSGFDILHGGEGDDTIMGGTENDLIFGDAGNDHLSGDEGNDFVIGGGGDDLLFGNAGNDNIYGEAGSDFLSGGEGIDVFLGGEGDDHLEGGEGDDVLYGDDASAGGAGQDSLLGGEGNDSLYGGGGDDRLEGGAGQDSLFASAGNDVLYGGTESDRFYFESPLPGGIAKIEDFAAGFETIEDFAAGDIPNRETIILDSLNFASLNEWVDGSGRLLERGFSRFEISDDPVANRSVGSDVRIVASARADGYFDIYYDANGDSLSDAIRFAMVKVVDGGVLDASDFYMY